MAGGPIRVLIADADRERTDRLAGFLADYPAVAFDVVCTARLDAAVEALTAAPFHVVLADLSLGDSTGLPTLSVLLAHVEDAPVIILSDTAEDTTTFLALQQGAADQLSRDQLSAMPVVRTIGYAVERGRARIALRESEERYRLLFQESREAIYMADGRGRIVEVNRAALELFGYEENELVGRDIASLFVDPLEYAHLEVEVARAGAIRGEEVRLRTRDGLELWCLLAATERRTPTGETLGLQGIIHDITERKQEEARLEHDALHDPLTGLPNRGLFMDRLEQVVRRSEREPEPSFALMFLDLDGFKEVNDTLGHDAGDEVLRRTGELLRSCVRAHDTVARLGGDEFVVLLDGIESVREATHVADRMIDVLGQPYRLRDRPFAISPSIGITWPTDGRRTPDELLREADQAMYRAKDRGGARHEVFGREAPAPAPAGADTDSCADPAQRRILGAHGGATMGTAHEPRSVTPGVLLMAGPGLEDPLREWLDRHGTLIAAAEARPHGRPLTGRGRVVVVPAPGSTDGERWVVRHYHRGGAVARFLGDRYLRTGRLRPFHEFRALERLRALGVPSPEPVAAAVYLHGLFYRGDLVTRWVPGSIDLAGCLFPTTSPETRPSPPTAMRAAGRLVRQLHDHGVLHPDLNLKNILLVPAPAPAPAPSAEPDALILDLDRAVVRPALNPRARRAMLERFWRSARKWERRTGHELDPTLRDAFQQGYGRKD
jgi:diguanylate cyclase (GGDEF)-like protein/PAS domain S-box-containing protein